jgi:UDP-GlcNAc:undecaprenyl-phosphate GlcNAc-1-phosphate transferase
MKRKTKTGDNVLIYGAGRGGELLLREIINNSSMKLRPLGFIDDNPLKKGKKLQGFPVLGSSADLQNLIRNKEINGLLVSFREPNGDQFDEIKAFCHQHGIYLKQFQIYLNDVRF